MHDINLEDHPEDSAHPECGSVGIDGAPPYMNMIHALWAAMVGL